MLVATALLAGTGGCAALIGSSDPAQVDARAEAQPPFTLKVLNEVNDGKTLYVRALIGLRTDWDLRRAQLILTGLANGAPAATERAGLNELTKAAGQEAVRAERGSEYEVTLSIPAAGVSDYQLELLWEEMQEAGSGGAVLELRDVRVSRADQCEGGSCRNAFAIDGELYNSGKEPIHRAVLAVGYARTTKAGALALVNEEQVNVDNLGLAPAAARQIRLEVETPHAGVLSDYEPAVRIVSYE